LCAAGAAFCVGRLPKVCPNTNQFPALVVSRYSSGSSGHAVAPRGK